MELDRKKIQGLLPYGEKFLFLDWARLDSPQSCCTKFRFSDDSDLIRSHLKGSGVVPGVILAEQACQAAMLTGAMHPGNRTESRRAYVIARLNCTFWSTALAPCEVVCDVTQEEQEFGFLRFKARSSVGEIRLASFDIHVGEKND